MGTIPCFAIVRDDGAEFEILSGFGAGLNAWRIPHKQGNMLDLLFGYRDGDDIYKIAPDTNAGCRLSPFPGRTAYAQFTWNSKTYQLINNVSWAPHALHGFLTNKEWQFENFESDSEKAIATFSCEWNGAFNGFPFPYKAINKVTFTGESYMVESIVKNIGDSPLPYSEGWHPYYMMGEKIDELTLLLPKSNLALLDNADLPTGNFKEDSRFIEGRKLGDEFINDCFCLNESDCKQHKAHVSLKSRTHCLDIWQYTGKEQYNAIQIYTPPTRESIAIEPMTSEPDALNHHRGLIVIAPGETRQFQFGATITQI
ncbi:MAG: aldose 1-epimerase [Fibrobacteraceae bacterium]|nr:aldose 1-epimerase [Fibrobacteraceae bacterium]